jgi:hypothetical protein
MGGCVSSCGPQDGPVDAAREALHQETPPVTDVGQGQIDEATRQAIESLGYLPGYEKQPERTGVTRHDATRAHAGYNLYISGHGPAAHLVDMEGAVLHSWSYDAHALYPVENSKDYFRRVHLCDNGDLYALVNLYGVIKLNRESELLWHSDAAELLHHDLSVDASGFLYAIGRKVAPIPEVHPETVIFDDTIVIFDDRGRKIKSFSIYDAFRDTEWSADIRDQVRQVLKWADPESRVPFEAFHTNTIEVFDGSLEGVSPLLGRGHAVLSSPIHRNVFIIDLESQRVVWNWFGPWERGIHQPTFLPNGHWLLFSNGARYTNDTDAASAVLEYTFPDHQVVWEYAGDSRSGEFYSRFSSLAQRLPNGNTLIVSSDEGRAFEVTSDKEIVWEFYNPNSVEQDMRGQKGFATRDDGKIIGTLFQLERVSAEIHDRWLKRTGS